MSRLGEVPVADDSEVPAYMDLHYVLATPEGKKQLANNLGERFQDNAEKILNASHTIILTTRADLPDSHLEAVFTKEKADGRFPDPSRSCGSR
ncbi:hypothetical protein [Streptomyces sp. NPDC096311]|uniref:hypothetical protein n=1 Tax=Streptomyces sp. NPDC096311 TaxID=3366083 RepID=UPI00380E5690